MTNRTACMCLPFIVLTSLACGAAQVDLVKTNTATIVTLPSQTHELYGVHAFQQEADFVIYGKIKKVQGFCRMPGHIDVAIVSKDAKTLSSFGIPIKMRGKKRMGWYGADYRARISLVVPRGSEVRIAFHGEHCYPKMTFDVPDNLAVPALSSPDL